MYYDIPLSMLKKWYSISSFYYISSKAKKWFIHNEYKKYENNNEKSWNKTSKILINALTNRGQQRGETRWVQWFQYASLISR